MRLTGNAHQNENPKNQLFGVLPAAAAPRRAGRGNDSGVIAGDLDAPACKFAKILQLFAKKVQKFAQIYAKS